MKILVTGGAGFIGSALIRHIINDTSHDVINLDKLTYAGNILSLDSIKNSKRYSFEHLDICNSKGVRHVLNQHEPDLVMHLAAESHVDRSIDSPQNFIQTNIIGTYTLLEECNNYFHSQNTPKKEIFKFHHVSTDEVFGDLPHPDSSKEINLPKFNEKSPYLPSSPYSASKASSDHLVRAWHKTYGLPVVISNCSNNYGPYHFPEKLIPLTILNAIEGKPLPIYGDGNQIRDWLFVEDHARALLKVACDGNIGETYNIGGNNEKRNIEVVLKICDLLDQIHYSHLKKLEIKTHSDLITHVQDRPGHDLRYSIDSTKIKNELGWKPRETFETGIDKTIRWYLENLNWVKQLEENGYNRKNECLDN